LVKETLRTSLKELGETHLKAGLFIEANVAFTKALDMSISFEDTYFFQYTLAYIAFLNQVDGLVSKYALDALSND
jgi:hypothetical protein